MTSWNDRLQTLIGKRRNVAILSPSASMPTFFTKGKWVSVLGQTGIIADLSGDGIAEVHYTNKAGVTTHVAFVPVANLQIAKLLQIPEPRRPTPERGALLGYGE